MAEYFRAIAADLDGTLTEDGRPTDGVLDAIRAVRATGRKVLLVTGRILSEVYELFADADGYFDAIVAENGAVVSIAGTPRVLAPPVDFELDEALVARAVTFRRGQVLLATQAVHDMTVTEEIRRLGLECQLVRNRGEMMILPPGISKGFGVFQALGALGISHHNAIGIGDAENDHSLLAVCEIGVAVANAVESLKNHADLVLERADGAGVAAFLAGPLLSDEVRVEPRRWRVELGRYAGGARASIPASQINLLITGSSKSGKSFVAGMLAERLIEFDYCLCVIDPEGDFEGLARLGGVVRLEGREAIASPERVRKILQHRFGSVIVDASALPPEAKERCARLVLEQAYRMREENGLPHWIVLDEALQAIGPQAGPFAALDLTRKGHCLVSYRPGELGDAIWDRLDAVLALPAGPDSVPGGARELVGALRRKLGKEVVAALGSARVGEAVLARPGTSAGPRVLGLASRASRHVRHWHKYAHAILRPELHFTFRDLSQEARHVARNVEEFHWVLRACDPDVLCHHASRGDLSRWVREAVGDSATAQAIHLLEERFRSTPRTDRDADALRLELLRVIETRYLG